VDVDCVPNTRRGMKPPEGLDGPEAIRPRISLPGDRSRVQLSGIDISDVNPVLRVVD
jgi:hypothetical protein